MKSANILDKKFWALALITGQVLSALSSFMWNENGRHTLNGSVVGFFSMLFWGIGMIGLFDLPKQQYPIYSRLGLLYAFYGIFGGVAFAFEGLYSTIFKISDKIGVEAHKQFPTQMNLVLFWCGPAFPLTLFILGFVLIRLKKVNWLTGLLLSLGGIVFPLGRILRIEWVAHTSDLLLLIPVCMIAHKFWNEKEPNE